MATLIVESLPVEYEISSIMDLLSISQSDIVSHTKEPMTAQFIFKDIELARQVQEAHQGEFFSGQTLFILVAECENLPVVEDEPVVISDKEEAKKEEEVALPPKIEVQEQEPLLPPSPAPVQASEIVLEEKIEANEHQPLLASSPAPVQSSDPASKAPVFDGNFEMNLKNISLPAKAGFFEDDPFNLLMDTKVFAGIVLVAQGLLMMSSFF